MKRPVLIISFLFFSFSFAVAYAEPKVKTKMPSILLELQSGINAGLNKIDANLFLAAEVLSKTGLEGMEARKVIQGLSASTPYLVDCNSVDNKGKLLIVEPAQYKHLEGVNIRRQKRLARLYRLKEPALSQIFRSLEGFDVVDFQYPVFSSKGKLIGSVSLLFKPEALLSSVIVPVIRRSPLEVWVMQKDGRILYDTDTKKIRKAFFSDQLYKSSPQFISLGKKITGQRMGLGTYEFLEKGKKPVKKEAYWTTIDLYGKEWRLVITRTFADSLAAD